MATYTTSPGTGGVLPQAWVGNLLREPLTQAALAFDPVCATTDITANVVSHYPMLTEDVAAAWVNEGQEISPDDAVFRELEVRPSKVGALTVVSREFQNDTSPAAAQVLGDSLANSLAERIDAAFFGALATPAPSGLGALTGVTEVIGDGPRTNLDDFASAISAAEQVGANVTAWVAHPMTVLALSILKEGAGSARPLLQPDPTVPGQSVIAGRPIRSSVHVPATDGLVWALDASRIRSVLREDVEITTSDQAFFSSDRIAVRGIVRVGFGFLHAASVVRLTAPA